GGRRRGPRRGGSGGGGSGWDRLVAPWCGRGRGGRGGGLLPENRCYTGVAHPLHDRHARLCRRLILRSGDAPAGGAPFKPSDGGGKPARAVTRRATAPTRAGAT